VGWTVGAGAEWMVAQHWSIKGEYLYYDLGSVTLNNAFFVTNGEGTPFFGATIASRASYNGNIVRLGVNYHF
jgi:outer membrane immunogenic protein